MVTRPGANEDSYDYRRQSAISNLSDVDPSTFRQTSEAEKSEDDFSNPLYRTSTDGSEVGARSIANRSRKAVGVEAYISDESTSSERGLHFSDVQSRHWSQEAGMQVQSFSMRANAFILVTDTLMTAMLEGEDHSS